MRDGHGPPPQERHTPQFCTAADQWPLHPFSPSAGATPLPDPRSEWAVFPCPHITAAASQALWPARTERNCQSLKQ